MGTRKSALALRQTELVMRVLERSWPEFDFQVFPIVTEGDRITDIPLSRIGGKGLFTQSLEEKILDGSVDMAVHSLKDLPTSLPDGLMLGAIPERECPSDAFISGSGLSLSALPPGAVVGTSSVSRSVQVLHARPDLVIKDIRGNVDTRLKKLDRGLYDAIVLAAAGLARLGLSNRITEELDWYHAVGQGALAVEVRAGDSRILELLMPLVHIPTIQAVTAERAFLRILQGGCHVPIGVRTFLEASHLTLHGLVARPDGSIRLTGAETGPVSEAEKIGEKLARVLLEKGARDILGSLQNE
jgi:hydroxymethylbilane synthase